MGWEKKKQKSNSFRFINDSIAINDGNEFEDHYDEVYPLEQILKKENISHTETTFLDFYLYLNEGQIKAS